MTPISILMSNVHEMDLHYGGSVEMAQRMRRCSVKRREVACVTNSHLQHIFIPGPESVVSLAFILAPLTGRMGASGAPQMGGTGVTRGTWPFSAVTLHFLTPEFSSGEGACQPLTHGRIRDLTFFHGTVGLRMDALFDFG